MPVLPVTVPTSTVILAVPYLIFLVTLIPIASNPLNLRSPEIVCHVCVFVPTLRIRRLERKFAMPTQALFLFDQHHPRHTALARAKWGEGGSVALCNQDD